MLFLRVFQQIRGTREGGFALRGRYWFPFFPPFFFWTRVDTSVRDSELAIPEGVVGSVQAAGFQTTQRVKGSLAPTRGDTSIGETPGVAALDLASRLPTFLARFDLLEFNSLPVSHFHHFGPSYGSFLCFSVPMKACHC